MWSCKTPNTCKKLWHVCQPFEHIKGLCKGILVINELNIASEYDENDSTASKIFMCKKDMAFMQIYGFIYIILIHFFFSLKSSYFIQSDIEGEIIKSIISSAGTYS